MGSAPARKPAFISAIRILELEKEKPTHIKARGVTLIQQHRNYDDLDDKTDHDICKGELFITTDKRLFTRVQNLP